ncbi:MAG: class I SAM-dependent methyltransferase [Bacteroidales bacterium]|nr:class I SAM-dependent methyltransferase [Bacteroidales bacterium]
MEKCNEEHQNKTYHNSRRGVTSFNKYDSELVFQKMNLQKGDVFVDLGCGAGDYSMYASKLVGSKGYVYAVDIQKEALESLNEEIKKLSLDNIETIENNLCEALKLKSNCTDHCFMATVMHGEKLSKECKSLFSEIKRVLKLGGQLTIVELKKEETPFGPPYDMRISPEELEAGITSYGFRKTAYTDLGFFYMMTFKNNK